MSMHEQFLHPHFYRWQQIKGKAIFWISPATITVQMLFFGAKIERVKQKLFQHSLFCALCNFISGKEKGLQHTIQSVIDF